VWCQTHFREKAREERGGGEGRRIGVERREQSLDGGKACPLAGDQAHLEVIRCSTGPRAASAQGTGLTQRLPKKKGGGVPQVGRGIRFDGRGGGEGLMRHSCPTAKVDPKWAQKEGKRRHQPG